MPKIVLIHTAASNEAVFENLCSELLPGASTQHVVDEGLLGDTIVAGHLTDDVRQRFRARAEAARADGADLILLTCSSIGESADGLAEELGVPVLRVDEAMADQAVALGSRIGVAATLPTTLEPTAALVRRAAEKAGRSVDVTTQLAEGAFQALREGRTDEHDSKVMAALRALAERTDVILLAQASMARAVAGADSIQAGERQVPILTSPRLGIERLRSVLG